MLLFCDQVFADGISGTDAVYTEPSIIHAGAEKLFVSARISMASSNGTLTIDSEHSADGVTWFTGATLISAGQFATGAVTTLYGQDAGGDVRACYMRFKISFGSSIDGFVRVIVTGRSRLRRPQSASRSMDTCGCSGGQGCRCGTHPAAGPRVASSASVRLPRLDAPPTALASSQLGGATLHDAQVAATARSGGLTRSRFPGASPRSPARSSALEDTGAPMLRGAPIPRAHGGGLVPSAFSRGAAAMLPSRGYELSPRCRFTTAPTPCGLGYCPLGMGCCWTLEGQVCMPQASWAACEEKCVIDCHRLSGDPGRYEQCVTQCSERIPLIVKRRAQCDPLQWRYPKPTL